MKINNILFLLGFLVLSNCAPRAIPVLIQPSPKSTESVKPSLDKVNQGIDNTIKSNSQISNELGIQNDQITNQSIVIEDAALQAKKIKEKSIAKQLVTEEESDNLILQINKINDTNIFLDNQNNELIKLKDFQLTLLDNAKSDGQETVIKLIGKEDEALQLRTQNQFLSSNLEIKNKEVGDLEKQVDKEKQHAAKSDVYRNWIWGLLAGFIIWTILKNVLMVYLPTTRFRLSYKYYYEEIIIGYIA